MIKNNNFGKTLQDRRKNDKLNQPIYFKYI